VCITELRSSLLALSAIAPGASTLCTNLYSTHRRPTDIDEEWLEEYSQGSCNELYLCSLAPRFVGWAVGDVALELFKRFGATLIALEGEGGAMRFLPQPVDAIIDSEHAVAHVRTPRIPCAPLLPSRAASLCSPHDLT
jgi:hypothetical protein